MGKSRLGWAPEMTREIYKSTQKTDEDQHHLISWRKVQWPEEQNGMAQSVKMWNHTGGDEEALYCSFTVINHEPTK